MADHVINMTMLGPSGVGKSSLLATMYREIGKMKTGFDLTPLDDTQDRLDDAYHKLSRVMERPVFSPSDDLLQGTQDFIEHRFEVAFRGTKEFDLIFHDFRGGVMMRNGEDLKNLRDRVASSHVIFNVLDSVALMEVDAVAGDKLNGHDRVCSLLTKTLNAEEKYLIVFVLVKCEAYIKTAERREKLVNRFEERHRAVLRLIERLNEAHKNVAALLIPAVTLGCVEFKEIDQGRFVFERVNRDFAPREVDQPLRYALAFALHHVNENRPWWDSLWDWVTGRGDAFHQALDDFCKQRDSSYKKYGIETLLEVNGRE